jgi:hypothetical protein
MRRREFIGLLAGSAAGRRKLSALLAGSWIARTGQTQAQPAQRVPIVGFLHPGSPELGSPVFDALRQGLRDVGYVEGETIKLEARWAGGRPEMLAHLTEELVHLPVAQLTAASAEVWAR